MIYAVVFCTRPNVTRGERRAKTKNYWYKVQSKNTKVAGDN